MKKYFIPFVVLLFLTATSCSEKTNIEEEKEAVLRVLQEETDAFIANDMERISAINILDGTTARISTGGKDVSIHNGWDEISKVFQNYFKINSSDNSWKNPKNTKSNIIIRVSGNSAWLVCDNTWEYEYNNVEGKFTNMQIAFFEKVNGEWKFSFDSYIKKPTENKNIELSKKYHERNLEDVDILLDDDFVGSYKQNESEPTLWNKENHKKAITNHPHVKDSILNQVAQGNRVATRFIRTVEVDGKIRKAEAMQFKLFKDGKIIKSWELFSPLQ